MVCVLKVTDLCFQGSLNAPAAEQGPLSNGEEVMLRSLIYVALGWVLILDATLAAANLPYPVREALRRQSSNLPKMEQLAETYATSAEAANYQGNINYGLEAIALADSFMRSLHRVGADLSHADIAVLVARVNTVRQKVNDVDLLMKANATKEAKVVASQPVKLSYAVREALRRQKSNISRMEQLVEQYETSAVAANFTGNINYGEEALGLANSFMDSLRAAMADLNHPEIAELVARVDAVKVKIRSLDSKMNNTDMANAASQNQSAETNTTDIAASTSTSVGSANVASAPKLPYPVREAMRRQTANVAAIENKLKQAMLEADKPLSPMQLQQQQMLQMMLATNKGLKQQLEANPSMLNQLMGGNMAGGLDGMEDQRLDSAVRDLTSSGADLSHPKVAALMARIETIKTDIESLRQKNLAKMTSAQEANDLSDYPDFEKNLKQVDDWRYTMDVAEKAVVAIQKLGAKDMQGEGYLSIDHYVDTDQLDALVRVHSNYDQMQADFQNWTQKYQPVFDRNSNYRQAWKLRGDRFTQSSLQAKDNASQVTSVLRQVLEANLTSIQSNFDRGVGMLKRTDLSNYNGMDEVKAAAYRIATRSAENFARLNQYYLDYLLALATPGTSDYIYAAEYADAIEINQQRAFNTFWQEWFIPTAKAKAEAFRLQKESFHGIDDDERSHLKKALIGVLADNNINESVIGIHIPKAWRHVSKIVGKTVNVAGQDYAVGERLEYNVIRIIGITDRSPAVAGLFHMEIIDRAGAKSWQITVIPLSNGMLNQNAIKKEHLPCGYLTVCEADVARAEQERLRQQPFSEWLKTADIEEKTLASKDVRGYFYSKDLYQDSDREWLERQARFTLEREFEDTNIIGYVIPQFWSESLLTEKIKIFIIEAVNDELGVVSNLTLQRNKNDRGTHTHMNPLWRYRFVKLEDLYANHIWTK
jgi:hypothetical protein